MRTLQSLLGRLGIFEINNKKRETNKVTTPISGDDHRTVFFVLITFNEWESLHRVVEASRRRQQQQE